MQQCIKNAVFISLITLTIVCANTNTSILCGLVLLVTPLVLKANEGCGLEEL